MRRGYQKGWMPRLPNKAAEEREEFAAKAAAKEREATKALQGMLVNHDTVPAFLGEGYVSLGNGNYRLTGGSRNW